MVFTVCFKWLVLLIGVYKYKQSKKNPNVHFCWVHSNWFMLLFSLRAMEMIVLSFLVLFWDLSQHTFFLTAFTTNFAIISPPLVFWWTIYDDNLKTLIPGRWCLTATNLSAGLYVFFPFLSCNGPSTGNMDQIERFVWHRWILAL